MIDLDWGDEWAAEDADDMLEVLEEADVDETEEWGRSELAGCWLGGMDG